MCSVIVFRTGRKKKRSGRTDLTVRGLLFWGKHREQKQNKKKMVWEEKKKRKKEKRAWEGPHYQATQNSVKKL